MRLQALTVGAVLLASLAATTASAQTTIYGIDLRNDNFFTTSTVGFVPNYSIVGAPAVSAFAIDFDANASSLWGIEYGTQSYGTFDLATGVFTALGTVGAVAAADNVSGLTCDVFDDWWMCNLSGGSSYLYKGDVTTGSFTLIGNMGVASMIDISIDSHGNLYGFSLDDNLYSINRVTGVATVIGASGFNANYAQGMDFDWSTDTLFATIYTGGGTGAFSQFDLTTGIATLLEDTLPLNAEMEMACEEAAPSQYATCQWYCGSGINMDTYTIVSPIVLGGTFTASVAIPAPNVGAVVAGYVGRLTFPIWGMEGLVNVAATEVMGLPTAFGGSPITLTWSVPSNPAYLGYSVFTQAAGVGGGVINLTCAFDCTAGY